MKCTFLLFSLLVLISCDNKNYKILKESTSMNVDRLQVELTGSMTEQELRTIAIELREDRKEYDKLWISFFQPDLLPDKSGNGAWAVASFTPGLEVSILQAPASATTEISFPTYSNVMEMLQAAGDYRDQCLQQLSKNGEPPHVRVSKEFLIDEATSNIKEQVKRDIIYVSFQAFAHTNCEKITVTSIPIIRSSFNPNIENDGKFQESLKLTRTISRKNAIGILDKYLHTSSFQDLYQLNGTTFLPNAKFDRLKFGELENVFTELK